MKLTNEKLVELMELESKATDGPWAIEDDQCIITLAEQGYEHQFAPVVCLSDLCLGDQCNRSDNGEFIAAFRNAAKALIEEVIESRKVIKSIAGDVEEYLDVDFWMAQPDCAEVIVNDTKLARSHLSKFTGSDE